MRLARSAPTAHDPAQIDNSLTPLGNPLNLSGLKNPGFPFWIAGVERHRRPAPADARRWTWRRAAGPQGRRLGRRPAAPHAGRRRRRRGRLRPPLARRHVNRLDLTKDIHKATSGLVSGGRHRPSRRRGHGLPRPARASQHHGEAGRQRRCRLPSSPTVPASRVPGAPFHDPCIDDTGKRLTAGVDRAASSTATAASASPAARPFNADNPRVYKGANIQFDAVLNKAGWHYPQERIIALWEDAIPIISKKKAAGTVGHPQQHLRLHHVPAHQPGAERLRAGRLPGAHHHRHHRPAHPPAQMGPHHHRRFRPTAGTTRTAPCRPTPCASASTPSTRFEPATALGNPERQRRTGAEQPPWSRRSIPSSGHGPGGQLAGRPHHAAALVLRPGGQRRRRAPRPGHHLHPRPFRAFHPPAGGALRHGADGAGGLHLGAQRDRRTAVRRPRTDGGPTSWQAAILTGDIDRDGQNDSYREFYLRVQRLPARLPAGGLRRPQPERRPGRIARRHQPTKSAINPPRVADVAQADPLNIVAYAVHLPGRIAAPLPGGHLRGRSRHHGGELPQRADWPARLRPQQARAGRQARRPGRRPGGDLALRCKAAPTAKVAGPERASPAPAATAARHGTKFPPPLHAKPAAILPGDPFTPHAAHLLSATASA